MALRDPKHDPTATGSPPAISNFPQDPSDFDSDPRISFSKLDNKFILETDDGQEYSYDTILKRWIPTVCARFAFPLEQNLHDPLSLLDLGGS